MSSEASGEWNKKDIRNAHPENYWNLRCLLGFEIEDLPDFNTDKRTSQTTRLDHKGLGEV